MRRLAIVIPLVSAFALILPASALAHGGPPTGNFTVTEQGVTQTVPFGDGMVTITFNSVSHVTEFADGHIHVNGNQTGTFFFVPNDPAGLTSSGRYTSPTSFTFGPNVFTQTSVFNVRGVAADGSRVCIKTRFHVTVVDGVEIVLHDVDNC
jgi:hypothetical protein